MNDWDGMSCVVCGGPLDDEIPHEVRGGLAHVGCCPVCEAAFDPDPSAG